jgi:hypothetical protein
MERRIHEGLAANDRAKCYVSLLGLAYEQAVSPKVVTMMTGISFVNGSRAAGGKPRCPGCRAT